MGKEGVEKAHLLLSHISLEMTHIISIHFLFVSTSHVVPHLLQEELGNIVPGWVDTSQHHLHAMEGCIMVHRYHFWPQRVFQAPVH